MTDLLLDNWIAVARCAELSDGEMCAVLIGNHSVAIYNVAGKIYATDNLCTHAYAFMTDGWLEGDIIECPLHGGRFRVQTGEGLGAPIDCDLKTYPVRIIDDEIQIKFRP
jgi:nitrite reductase/ring-hydroxylating ferredoxin subunit